MSEYRAEVLCDKWPTLMWICECGETRRGFKSLITAVVDRNQHEQSHKKAAK